MAEVMLTIADLPPQGRQLEAARGEILKLAKDISSDGLQNPIIVADGVVVDGLKRIEAFKRLRLTTIPAHVAGDLGELYELMKGNNRIHRRSADNDHLAATRRAIALASELEQFNEAWKNARRGNNGRMGRKAMTGPAAGIPTLKVMATIMGVTRGKAELIFRYSKLAETDPDVRKMWDQVLDGTETVYGIFMRLEMKRKARNQKPRRNAVPLARGVMERGTRILDTTLDEMSKFGGLGVLPEEERKDLLMVLARQRRALGRLIRTIRAETYSIEEEEEE